ncbi:MAG: asparagine synthase (glutamine-hydrolyzing) [Deltaproteobacteria bacterium]|nr:asparagine synthase (glutamine-hydrolyzing) [Deltaproteobacteria bacterium]
MCGICGIYNFDHTLPVNPAEIHAMNQTLRHRGPDDEGSYVEGPVGLGIRRLSIIDVAGGRQPIANEDQTVWVVFNGEIYNYKDLRQSLIKKGHRFTTQSDTESILHLYEEVGLDFVNQLRGMFAIAIWDGGQNRLILARDRLGIKPLFYARHNNTLLFASEMKAILQSKDFPREMDDNALAAYFTLSYIPAPLTIFKKIQKVLPGHIMTIQDGDIADKQYWDVQFRPDRSRDESYFIEGVMDLLEQSVEMRLMSEVPLGAFLSGGIDSSTIVALMSKANGSPVNTFTVGFGGDTGGYLDERKYARHGGQPIFNSPPGKRSVAEPPRPHGKDRQII